MKPLALQKHIAHLTREEFPLFLSDLSKINILTIDEELQLTHRIHQGGIEAEQAKETLAYSYLRIIHSVAKRHKHLNISLQQLILIGITGLIKAAEKYDDTRGFKFTSYAVWWIRQSMIHKLKNSKT